MKFDKLPKIFAVTFLALSLVLFQKESLKTVQQEFFNLIGLDKNGRSSRKTKLNKVLPVTAYYSRPAPFVTPQVFTSPTPVFTVAPVQAADPLVTLFDTAEFDQFVDSVANGAAGVVRGVYVPGVLANRVIQQPANDWAFVSDEADLLTEFQSARSNGVTGLLAHNYLLGEQFYNLVAGDYAAVVYGDGTYKIYLVAEIDQYQKLTTSSLTSDMVDLETGERLTSSQVFNRYYNGSEKLTFQTCLERDGKSNWGLTFTVALPVE
jgi:hypothetical protein